MLTRLASLTARRSFAETVRHRLLNHALETYMKDLVDLLDTAVALDTLYSPGWKDEPATERNLDEKGRRKALVENFVKVCETHARGEKRRGVRGAKRRGCFAALPTPRIKYTLN